MLETALGFAGSVTAPHRAASLTGRDVLKAGGAEGLRRALRKLSGAELILASQGLSFRRARVLRLLRQGVPAPVILLIAGGRSALRELSRAMFGGLPSVHHR